MSVGEQWVQTPAFPILMELLASWVFFCTIAVVRNWFMIKNLRKQLRQIQSAAKITSTTEIPTENDDVESGAAIDTLKELRVKLNK